MVVTAFGWVAWRGAQDLVVTARKGVECRDMRKYLCSVEYPAGHPHEDLNYAEDWVFISTREADVKRFARDSIKEGAECVNVYHNCKEYGTSLCGILCSLEDVKKW